jgi:deoxyadenosine/deoxycytidine kinase
LDAQLGWRTSFELVADNPYLADFHADMGQCSFVGQVGGEATIPPGYSTRRK